MIKVSIAMGARAHAYRLALELQEQGKLCRLFTYYPRFAIDPRLRASTSTFPWMHAASIGMRRVGLTRPAESLRIPADKVYDRWVAQSLEGCGVFMAMSGLGLLSRRAAKRIGALSVCDRGSSHIEYQDEIMAREYSRQGLAYRRTDPNVVEYEKQEYEESDLIVVQSSFAYRSFLLKGISQSKVIWISPGVDLAAFRPLDKRDGIFRILYVGQISLRKGIPDLLEAFAPIKSNDCELVLSGSVEPEIAPLLSRYEGCFRYAGKNHSREALCELYSSASVLVLPSIEDGFGLVLREAMACGLPIVATVNTGGPDVVSDGVEGFTVPIRSPEAIREKLLFLSNNPETREAMARAALQRTQHADWHQYASTVIGAYTDRLERFVRSERLSI